MGSTLYLKVEGAAGGTISEICEEIAKLAERVGVAVQCNINGVEVIGHPGATGPALYKSYCRSVDRKIPFAFA